MEGLNKPFRYMHNNNLIHRDIKPENIMIKYVDSSKTKFIPKIADYGIAKEIEEGFTDTQVGTARYRAPEIMGPKNYNDTADLYSIGVMMYQLYFNSFPFDLYVNFNKIIKKEEDCEDKILDDLLNKLLVFNPDKRISWEEYFDHPFFNHNKGVEDLNKKVENLKIDDKKENQIINYPDNTLKNLISKNYEEKETIKNIPPKKLISFNESLNLKNKPYDKNLVNLVERMYRDNPEERPDTFQAIKELESIEKNINNINNKIGNSNDDKIITSMKSILQCFCIIIENKELIKNIIINKSGNQINNNIFLYYFLIFLI